MPQQSWTERLVRYQYLEPLLAGKRVLEVGCGTGRGAEHVACFAQDVLGIDDSSLAVAQARHANAHTNLRFAVGSPDRIDAPSYTFDVVLVPELQRWITRGALIPELRRVLVPGGLAVLSAKSADVDEDAEGIAYKDLTEYLAQAFGHVRLVGELCFAGTIMADFAPDGELDPTLECSLVEEDEPPHTYLALCGDQSVPALGYTVVQSPSLQAEDLAGAERLQDETDQLRQRLAHAESRTDEWAPESVSATTEVLSQRSESHRLNERISALQGELDQLGPVRSTEEYEQLWAENQSLRDELIALSELGEDPTVAEGGDEIVELRERLAAAEREVLTESTRARSEVTQTRREARQHQEDSIRAKEELHAVQAALQEARRLLKRRHDSEELSQLRQRVAELEALGQSDRWRIDELMARLRSNEGRSEVRAEGSAPVAEEQPQGQVEVEQLRAAKQNLEGRLKRAEERRVKLERRLSRMQAAGTGPEASVEESTAKELSLLRADLARSQARIAELESRCDKLLTELQGVSAAAAENIDGEELLRVQQRQLDTLLGGAALHRDEAMRLQSRVEELGELVDELQAGRVGQDDALRICEERYASAEARSGEYQSQLSARGRELAMAEGELIKLRGRQKTR